MRKNILFFLLATLIPVLLLSQDKPAPRDPWKNTREGNIAYGKGDFTTAEKKYNEAILKDTCKNAAKFNLGNALYRQKKYDEAGKNYADVVGGTNKDSLNKGWYNLGNSLLEQKKYSESINAYKEALRNNPADENARYNLAYAQKKLQQQQQKQSGGNDNNKDQQKDKKDQKKDDKKDKDDQKKDQDKDKKSDQKDQAKPEMTPQEAKQMMDALKNEEQKTRQRINQKGKNSGFRRSKDKDW